MKKENKLTVVAGSGEAQDDISALSKAFSLNAFHYVDIARHERLKKMNERWPLLAELTQLHSGNNH